MVDPEQFDGDSDPNLRRQGENKNFFKKLIFPNI